MAVGQTGHLGSIVTSLATQENVLDNAGARTRCQCMAEKYAREMAQKLLLATQIFAQVTILFISTCLNARPIQTI